MAVDLGRPCPGWEAFGFDSAAMSAAYAGNLDRSTRAETSRRRSTQRPVDAGDPQLHRRRDREPLRFLRRPSCTTTRRSRLRAGVGAPSSRASLRRPALGPGGGRQVPRGPARLPQPHRPLAPHRRLDAAVDHAAQPRRPLRTARRRAAGGRAPKRGGRGPGVIRARRPHHGHRRRRQRELRPTARGRRRPRPDPRGGPHAGPRRHHRVVAAT